MIALAESVKNARLQAIADALDAAATPAVLIIYDGTRPAAGAAITDQVALATLTFSKPAASSIDAGTLTFDAIGQDMADADGTATWARVLDGDGAFVFDADVAEAGADFTISEATIYAGGLVLVTAATISEA